MANRWLSFEERFNQSVVRQPGCWGWVGYIHTTGYARIRYNGQVKHAHIAAFEVYVRPLDLGEVVHHKCGTKHCTNPDHLEATYQADHVVAHHSGSIRTKEARQRMSAAQKKSETIRIRDTNGRFV